MNLKTVNLYSSSYSKLWPVRAHDRYEAARLLEVDVRYVECRERNLRRTDEEISLARECRELAARYGWAPPNKGYAHVDAADDGKEVA